MPLYAVTATDHAATIAALAGPIFIIAVVAAGGYALSCWLWPFGNCRRCHGSGRRHSLFSHRVFRDCPRCHGTGKRLRLGRRVLNHLRALHDKGTR